MSKNNQNKLIPTLRFPDFSKDGEWQSNRLGYVYDFITTNSFSRDDLSYVNGNVKNIHYGDIHTKFSTLFDITKENVPFINESIPLDKFKKENYCKEGDMIFADASEDLKDVGKSIELVNLNNEKLLSGLHTLLARQINSEFISGFGGYLFLNDIVRKQIQRESQGAKVLGISATRLSNINIFYPKEKKEQQKISACLSSLDKVITAESQKLDILRDHKRGLLQNLLPQEGEIVPKLRFSRFEESGDWKETTLTQVADYENGKAHEQDIDSAGDFIVVNSKFISQDGEVKKFTNTAFCPTTKGDILMVLSDIPNGKAIAKCFLVEEDNRYTVNQRICRITPRNLNSKILYYLLNRNPYFLAFDDGVKQTNLRKEDVLNCPLLIPTNPKEQDKIADTLSSIDDLCNAQSQKVEALKLHKKGLLQGLFPDVNEVNA
jgi:type I restriction enzyme, S subunit